jgi:hypothetical protein
VRTDGPASVVRTINAAKPPITDKAEETEDSIVGVQMIEPLTAEGIGFVQAEGKAKK